MELNAPGAAIAGDLARHLPQLLGDAGVTSVQLDVLTRPESFRGGSISDRAQEITGVAREEHRARHFGFWEFVLAQTPQADPNTRLGLLVGATRHHSAETISVLLELRQFAEALLAGSFEGLPPRTIASLTSNVTLERDSGDWHLPMLDMGLPINPRGQATCIDAVATLGLEGLLLESGRSYHFIGSEPCDADALIKILARAQLLSPIIDARWASHQLLEGYCALRISSDDPSRSSHRVVATIKRR